MATTLTSHPMLTRLVLASSLLGPAILGCQDAPAPPIQQPPAAERVAQTRPAEVREAPAPAGQPTTLTTATPKVDNVLLITVDALRADQPWSGYEGARTPNLSRLASQSVVFDSMYSVANTTMPSLSALMLARYPSELQRDDCGLPALWGPDTLAEAVSAQKIHTVGFHGHAIFAGSFAPSKGFEEWRLVKNVAGRNATLGAVTGSDITALATEFVRERASQGRFMAWMHYVDPHDSYVRHDDFPPSASPVRGLYDGEVAYTDAQIGAVLGALEAAGLADRTAVIVTADHGEGFGEHKRFRHGLTLFNEEVHVPFMMRVPGVAPSHVTTPRSLIDVARTTSELLSVPPSSHWRGTSFVSDLTGAPAPVRPILIDAPAFGTLQPQRAAILDGQTKVFVRGFQAGQMFDLTADAAEQRATTLAATDPQRQQAQALFDALPAVEPQHCHRD